MLRPSVFPTLPSPASRLGVDKRFGGDAARTADPDCPVGYSTPHNIMLSCVPKLPLLRHQLVIGLLVMSDCFCITCLFLSPSHHLNCFYLDPRGFFPPLHFCLSSSLPHPTAAELGGGQDTGCRLEPFSWCQPTMVLFGTQHGAQDNCRFDQNVPDWIYGCYTCLTSCYLPLLVSALTFLFSTLVCLFPYLLPFLLYTKFQDSLMAAFGFCSVTDATWGKWVALIM